MRDYGFVYTRFWASPDIQKLSDQAKLLAVYLLTGPHSNMLGCFRLPAGYIAEDLRWSSETVSKRLDELFQIGFITRDEETGWIIIHRFLTWNPIENPNQGKSIYKLFEQVPEKSLIYRVLVEILLEHNKFLSEPFRNRLQTLAKQFRNQEQDQEQKQDQDIKEKQAKEKIASPKNNTNIQQINEIFNFWKKTLNHPNAKLDEIRKNYIRKAFQAGYSFSQLCDAITGCSKTPHNMGHNERGERYDGLHVIFRNAENIERFIRNCHQPPTTSENQLQQTLQSKNNWRLPDENFDKKQYYSTPDSDIKWLNAK